MEVWITLLCVPRQKPGGSITLSFLKESFENKPFCQQVKMTLLPSTPQNQHIAKNIFHLWFSLVHVTGMVNGLTDNGQDRNVQRIPLGHIPNTVLPLWLWLMPTLLVKSRWNLKCFQAFEFYFLFCNGGLLDSALKPFCNTLRSRRVSSPCKSLAQRFIFFYHFLQSVEGKASLKQQQRSWNGQWGACCTMQRPSLLCLKRQTLNMPVPLSSTSELS